MASFVRSATLAIALCTTLPAVLAQGPGVSASEPAAIPMGPGGRMHMDAAGMNLLTPDERANFCSRMRTSRSPEERQQVAAQMHSLMQVRAQERGVTLSEGHSMRRGGGCQAYASARGPSATSPTAAAPITEGAPPIRHLGEITYQTGGVGVDEVAAMRRTASEYNLRLTFAGPGGQSLSGVNTSILGPKGQEVFTAVSEGPFLYVKMPPGTYRVVATADGVKKESSVTVPKRGAVARSFAWPS